MRPDFVEAYHSLGLALASTGHPQQAVRQFEQALRFRQDVKIYLNLAIVYAQMGQSADAIAAAQQAVGLARSQGSADEARHVEAWLSAYRASLSPPSP